METMTIDEAAMIIGAKELENYQLRKELARTRQVLAQVTQGTEKANGEATEATGNSDDASADDDEDDER